MGALAKAIGLKSASAGPSVSVDGTFSVAPWFSALGWGARTSSGATISESSAMGIVTVYACVRVLAESVASLPLILYRRLPGGGADRAPDHHLYPVFHDAPNPEMTSFVWRETVMQHLTTWGNSYNEIAFDSDRQMQLWPLAPNRVEVKWENGQRRYYYLSRTGERKALAPGTVLHITGLSTNGLVGVPPIALQREALGLYQSLQDYGSNTMRNSARPAAVLEHPKTLSPGAIERLATQMDQLRGAGNAGKTVVMEEGLTLHEIGIPPKDAQYIEARKFQVREICRMFRVQPHMVQDLEQATFSNIEQQSIEFVRDTVRPWLVRIEQEVKKTLLPHDPDIYVEFLLDGLQRADSVPRAQALQIQHQAGVLSDNEWRAIENRNPKDPDSYWQPSGSNYLLAPISDGTEQINTQPFQPPQLSVVKSASGMREVRCIGCNHSHGAATPPYQFTCPKCKAVTSEAAPVKSADPMLGLTEAVLALASRPNPATEIRVMPPVDLPPVNVEASQPVVVPAPVVTVSTESFAEALDQLRGAVEELAKPRMRTLIRDVEGRLVAVEA